MDLQMFVLSPVATTIFVLTIFTSIKAFKDPHLKYKFLFNPYRLTRNKEWHQVFTHGLIHANWMHLGFNMLAFYFFAFSLETIIGHYEFFVLYMMSLVISTIPGLIQHKDNDLYNALGASGAVSAVVMSFILIMPDIELMFILLPIPMPGWVLGLLYIGYSFYASLRRTDNIAHDAHLWGALSGIVITVLLKPEVATQFMEWLSYKFS